MNKYSFVVNLKPETYRAEFKDTLNPHAYLLAANNATPQMERIALSLRDEGIPLFADNGNFTFISKIADEFQSIASKRTTSIREEEISFGHSARAGELSNRLRAQCTQVAKKVQQRVLQVVGSGEAAIEKQLTLKPSHLIGVEDITMAVLLALNLEPTYLNLKRQDYCRFNESVTRRAVVRMTRLDSKLAKNYYPVASAVSYNTAYDAGATFAKRGLKKVAMGFGAYMADNNYTDHIYIDRRRIDLLIPMPNRYIRTAVAAKGFWDGYIHASDSPPLAFHFLGLGAPIMIGLVSLAAWGTRELTFDATSPIKDAIEGTMYVSKPAILKIETRKVALRLATQQNAEWNCPCPFCTKFTAKHPFHYQEGRNWFKSKGKQNITDDDLAAGGGLFSAFPLLSEPKAGPLRADVSFARIGHNHWVLEEIMALMQDNSTSYTQMVRYMDSVVKAYEANTNSEICAKSVRFAFNLVLGKFNRAIEKP